MGRLQQIKGAAGLSHGEQKPGNLKPQSPEWTDVDSLWFAYSMENTGDYRHKPVLLKEAIDLLVTDPEGLYLDATMGLGGHSESILRALSQRGKLLGMDLDPEAVSLTQTRLKDFPGQFKAVYANFRSAAGVLEAEKFFPLTGALFDLGVSSMQLDKPERALSIM